MALNRMCSEEFSFPLLPSGVSSIGSPPLWKHSPENFNRRDYDQWKSFSYVERRSLCIDRTEEKMDMLWEDLNEELPQRSKSLRIDPGGEKRSSLLSEESSAVSVACGMNLTKKTPKKKKKKKSPNVLVLMRVLKKLVVLQSSSKRSPAKTHPR